MTEATRTIPLSRALVARVDEADYDELSKHKWYARYSESSRSWYAFRSGYVNGKRSTIQMARQILGLKHGDARQPDHKNHDTLDNVRGNLRIATRKQNCRNRRRRTDNVSTFKGVSWNKGASKSGRWRAQIWVNGTNKLIGHFDDPIEAAKAYDRRARQEQGEFAYTNFPAEQVAA
ncbi:hypothetical protein [Tunturiibacter gelidiferens]|uniref:hypothetical protein n=1 Tax=Tunturiibacter gelidiferens TaxID=3069689 RepID=UPI003D9BF0B1